MRALLLYLVTGCAVYGQNLNDLSREALRHLGMNIHDLSMPADWLPSDPHRVKFHDTLFLQPLQAVSIAERLATEARELTTRADQRLFSDLFLLLELGYSVAPLTALETSDDPVPLTTPTGESADVTDHGTHILVQRILSRMKATQTAVLRCRERYRNMPMIEQIADSVWMTSNDDPSTSLFTAYQHERKEAEQVAAFADLAQPAWFEDGFRSGAELYLTLFSIVGSAIANPEAIGSAPAVQILDTPVGRIAIGTRGPDVFEGDFALIFDPGGNDIYRIGPTDRSGVRTHAVRCIIDLGGNDIYLGGNYTLGCGFFGIGIVIDARGNDFYNSGDFSQGCGIFGVGILHDVQGNDTYVAGHNAQAAGMFGVGLLLDNEGNDSYSCYSQAQAFGGTRGAGILLDADGNDSYIARSPVVDKLRYDDHFTTFSQGAALGMRPYASGGIAILNDVGGNDYYACDIFGQGTAYWYGLGALLDNAGSDRYLAHQYAQGSGVHLATGILVDSSGNDVYVSHGVSQGCGHDVATGLLYDISGNDNYVVESLSLGGGNANAVSLFFDQIGNDSYSIGDTTNTLGYSDFRRWSGMIGVFHDGGGTDRHTDLRKNNSISVKSTYGVFVDTESKQTSARSPLSTTAPTEPGSAVVLSQSFDSLFIQASAAPLRYQPAVEPARNALVAMGTAILDSMWKHMTTKMPRERLTLEYVLPKMHAAFPEQVDSFLIRCLNDSDPTRVSHACTIAALSKSKGCVPSLLSLTFSETWRTRRMAALALGQIGSSSALPRLRRLAKDAHPYVRARAGYALGISDSTSPLTSYFELLTDGEQIVRNTTVEGLARGIRRPMAELIAFWKRGKTHADRMTMARLLPCAEASPQNIKAFSLWLNSASTDWKSVFRLIIPSVAPEWNTFVR